MRPTAPRFGVTLLFPLALAALLGGGCAKYEYALLQPPEAAGVVAGHEDFAEVERDPLTYRFRAREGRLVVQIYNPTPDPVRLLGDRSVAVDPDGQSHPLPTQTIAPDSYGKLILPPPTPKIRGYGPSFGVGLGTSIGYGGHGRRGLGHPGFAAGVGSRRSYYSVIDEGNNYYWDWDGQTVARLSLVFERGVSDPTGGEDVFTHEFVIARRKVE